MRNKLLKAIFALGCVAVVGIAILVTMFAKNNFGNDKLICSGIKIGSIDVGGLTEEEAETAVNDFVTAMEEKQITIHVGEEQVVASAREMGLSFPANDFPKKALAVGKSGNFWKRFQEIGRAERGNIIYDLTPDLD